MTTPIASALCLLLTGFVPLAAQDEPPRSQEPPSLDEVDAAIERGVALLLSMQEDYVADPPIGTLPEERLLGWQAEERARLEALRAESGPGHEWPYEGVYRVGRRGQIPAGYRVGGTAIVCTALMAAPGFAEDEARRAAVIRGVELCRELVQDSPEMAPGPKRGYDVRGWGHAYALRLFVRALDAELVEGEQAEVLRELVPHLLHCLDVNQTSGGGWNYAGNSCSPFMTGSTLLTLFEVRELGYEVDAEMIERALDGLEAGRSDENGAYAYSGVGNEPMAASAARASVAELSLLRGGRGGVEQLRGAVRGFFDNWEHLLDRKSKQGTHIGPYSIAPYYFFYGHTYTALAIESLPQSERPVWRGRMAELLWRTREESGGWNDRVFPRSEAYGTAMAVLALTAPQTSARGREL